jgi:hypothetical protein
MKYQLLSLAILLCLAACDQPHRPTPMFYNGERVITKVGHLDAMVINSDCWDGDDVCSYDIRMYKSESATNTHITSDDGYIAADQFAIVHVREFEIEKVKILGVKR